MPNLDSVASKERVSITYKPASGNAREEVELPLRLLFLGDFTQRPDPRSLEDRHPISIDNDTFDRVMMTQKLSLQISVPDKLSDTPGGELALNLHFKRHSDFEPDAILLQVPALKTLLDQRAGTHNPAIESKLAHQLDEILHHPQFKRLDAAWRGLKFVVDHIQFRENIQIEILNCSKEDLLADFEDSRAVTSSGLYKLAYTAEYAEPGGKPYGAIVSNYELSASAQDISLLQHCAAVAALAQAPFLASPSPQFFGLQSYLELPNLKDPRSLFEGPQYTKWQSFRESDDSRYVGLVLPRFLLRPLYGSGTATVRSFNYAESGSGNHDAYCWCSATYALATRLADSFARYRWCPNIIGPNGGGDMGVLPLHPHELQTDSQTSFELPTEVRLTERREYELSEEGFVGLTFNTQLPNACFYSANSAQKPKFFGSSDAGRASELSYRLMTQLPYLFIACRVAGYLQVVHRDQIGAGNDRATLERNLNLWLGQYVLNQDNATSELRSRHPFRVAQISVSDDPSSAGCYKFALKLTPHFKYQGTSFTLMTTGRFDKN